MIYVLFADIVFFGETLPQRFFLCAGEVNFMMRLTFEGGREEGRDG